MKRTMQMLLCSLLILTLCACNKTEAEPEKETYSEAVCQDDSDRIGGEAVKNINHRGYNALAPENTLPAFQLSKLMGFEYVETDVALTSDGVPVLLHDDTINRTSNGTGAITSMTLEQVRQYDFGSWKASEYAGTPIPTLDEFFGLCKNAGLKPYVELKFDAPFTQEKVDECVAMAEKYGIETDVTWLSSNYAFLKYAHESDPQARLGVICNVAGSEAIGMVYGLKTSENDVFIDCRYSGLQSYMINRCKKAGIPLEVWMSDEVPEELDGYISGFTADNAIAENPS